MRYTTVPSCTQLRRHTGMLARDPFLECHGEYRTVPHCVRARRTSNSGRRSGAAAGSTALTRNVRHTGNVPGGYYDEVIGRVLRNHLLATVGVLGVGGEGRGRQELGVGCNIR